MIHALSWDHRTGQVGSVPQKKGMPAPEGQGWGDHVIVVNCEAQLLPSFTVCGHLDT